MTRPLRPFFSDKDVNSSKNNFSGKNAVVVDEELITCSIMNNYFINTIKNHNLNPLGQNKVDIYMFENHISIKKCMKPSRILF